MATSFIVAPTARLAIAGLCLWLCAGCSREPTPAAGGKDYQQMLDRARNRQSAERSLGEIRSGIQKCQIQLGRVPTNLYDLVRLGYLKDLPAPPDGMTYYYDPLRGNVRFVPMPEAQRARPPAPAAPPSTP